MSEDYLISTKSPGNQVVTPQRIQFTRTAETFITRNSAIAKLKSLQFSEGSPVIIKYKINDTDNHTYLILAVGTGNGVGRYEIVSDSEITLQAIDDQINGRKGGLWTVSNEYERLNIPTDKKEIGMLVYQMDESRYWVLNVHDEWEIFKPESSKIDGGYLNDPNHNRINFVKSSEIEVDKESAIEKMKSGFGDLKYSEPAVIRYRNGSETKLLYGIGTGISSDPVMIIGSLDDTNESIENLSNKIGDLNNLETTDKSNIVNSINEIKYNADNLKERVDTIQGDETVENSILYHIKNYDDTLSLDPGEF